MTPSLSVECNHPVLSSRAWLGCLRGQTMARQEKPHRSMRTQDEFRARLRQLNSKWDERPVRDQPQPRWGCSVFPSSTQGSRLAATLGFATESLWDSSAKYVQSPAAGWKACSTKTATFLRFAWRPSNSSRHQKPRSVWSAVDLSPLWVEPRSAAAPRQSGAQALLLIRNAMHVRDQFFVASWKCLRRRQPRAMSIRRRRPLPKLSAPGWPSLVRPRNPPRRATRRLASAKVKVCRRGTFF